MLEMLNALVYSISAMGALVIVWGIVLVLKDFLMDLFNDDLGAKRKMRQKLGSYLILGLEFFIAADIIRTITRPDWNEIGMLASIVALRTVLSYFLGLEIKKKA
jgi:uncharacterized membrane protein